MRRRDLPSTLRTDFRDDIRLLDSGFVRFWAAAGLIAALLLPLALTNFWTGIANQVFIAVIGALALNLLMGTTGQISLGHAGFVAAGAFTVAALITHFQAPIGLTLLAAAAVGAVLGVLVGLPALRLKGLYLAVSTLAAHFVIIVGVGQYQSAISYGSGFNIPSPAILGLEIGSERAWYFFLLPFALGVLLLNLNWLRSAYGRAWMAIRHRDIAAAAMGINVARYKLLAFSASTSLTCVAGALWAYHTAFVSVEAFDFDLLIQYLAMVIIGGLGSVLGACLGALFVVVLPHVISILAAKISFLQGLGGTTFDLQVGVFGVVMLLFLIFEPRGLSGIWARAQFYFQLWPFKYRAWES
jgi:branched-chain amino acid transport system permease protein